MLLDGLYVPLTAPFYRDGALYLRKVEHNAARYSLSPASGLIALGPGGEGGTLNDAETVEFLRSVSASAAPEKVLIAGVHRGSVRTALELMDAAAESRFDAVLVGAPSGWLATDASAAHAELRTWFLTLADRSPLPLVLESTPAAVLSSEVIAELAQHANILGLLDTHLTAERAAEIFAATKDVQREVTVTSVFAAVTGRMLSVQSVGAATFVDAQALASGHAAVATAPPAPALRTRSKQTGFQLIGGGKSAMLPLLEAGVKAVSPALAACAPQACHEVYAAFTDGDPKLAAEKQTRIREAVRLMSEVLGVAGIKYACDLNGYYGGLPRLPLLGLDAAQKAFVDEAMRELRN